MGPLILALVVFAVVLVGPRFLPEHLKWACLPIRIIGPLAIFGLLAATSFVFIGENKTGHMHKIYGSKSLQDGAIIAANDEKGPQAEIIPPGFHLIPFLNIIYKVSEKDVVVIQDGKYGYLVARDGVPLRTDQTYADAFDPAESAQMINNARYFLTHGGQKGPQTSVLTPGTHRLNDFLWKVKEENATTIPAGFVGVIKSNVHSGVDFGNLKTVKPEDCSPTKLANVGGGALEVPLVPVGCIGIWDTALNPGQYYINEKAYDLIDLETRVNAWEYKGGYWKRSLRVVITNEGKIELQEEEVREGAEYDKRGIFVKKPDSAVDEAVFAKIEGWDVPIELRVLVQVTPANAPFVVASVGGLKQVEENILTPSIRSVTRNVVGGFVEAPTPILDKKGIPVLDESGVPKSRIITRPTRVYDLIENRPIIEAEIERVIIPEGLKAGVNIKEIRLGDTAIPPELLYPRQREQVATQLAKSYIQEQLAQQERIATEQTRATADQQDVLVRAQIAVKSSEQYALARENEGRGEKKKLTLIAEGQKKQVAVLGEEKVVELRKYELLLNKGFEFISEHPEVLTAALSNAHKFVPERVFTLGGDGNNSLLGAAGILGDFLSPGKSQVQKQVPASVESGKGN